MIAAQLVGSWRLEQCTVLDDAGAVYHPLGPQAVGLLLYGADGRMSVSIMAGGRPAFEVADILQGSEAERAAAAASYLSYAGWYELAGPYLRHGVEISLFPNWVGTVQERRWSLVGDCLRLATDPMLLGACTCIAEMAWRRLPFAGDVRKTPQ